MTAGRVDARMELMNEGGTGQKSGRPVKRLLRDCNSENLGSGPEAGEK